MNFYSTGPEFLEIYPAIAKRVGNITFLDTYCFEMLKSTVTGNAEESRLRIAAINTAREDEVHAR